ncbi:MAG: nitroreductase family protein [Terracidiphilus sp.]|jgi:nitroreductase/NAD-dependent dihydropyrimidine dehydrogenase PreA subunit
MGLIDVDKSLCRKDGACVAVCPARILAIGKDGFPEAFDESRCILCGHCAAVCPHGAFTHTELPEGPFLPAVKKLPDPALMDGFLMGRRSVREFKDRPVARPVLEALLDVARRAPTATNSQTLHWIVVEGKDKLYALSQAVVDGAQSAGVNAALLKQWDDGYDFVLRGAPALVVACAPEEYGWRKEDCAIALTFLELAAEARGLGVCWAGYLTRISAIHAPLRKILSVPDGYAVCGALMLGEGRYSYRRIPPRKPLSVQWN